MQVDGGSEFRKYLEEACSLLNIELYILPSYSPKYNGRIRTSREEFYANKHLLCTCANRDDYNEKLEEYIYKYNNYRPDEALDYLIPMRYHKNLVNVR